MLNVGIQRSKAIELSNKIEWKLGNAENLLNEKDNSYDVRAL
jgi:ubiquinone/menaquinone biosynthesis C-methylase UbiE